MRRSDREEYGTSAFESAGESPSEVGRQNTSKVLLKTDSHLLLWLWLHSVPLSRLLAARPELGLD